MNTDKGKRFNTEGTEERRRQIGEGRKIYLRERSENREHDNYSSYP